jgi:hypothetical protein
MTEPSVQLIPHPPERRRRPGVTLCCGCSCCCCCCCLHTLGSVLGAAVAPAIGNRRRMDVGPGVRNPWDRDELDEGYETGVAIPDLQKRPGRSRVEMYWWIVLLLIGITLAITLTQLYDVVSGFLVGLLVVALILPILQVISSVFTMIVVCLAAAPNRNLQLKQQGKILLGTLIGAGAGIAVMVGLFALFAMSTK